MPAPGQLSPPRGLRSPPTPPPPPTAPGPCGPHARALGCAHAQCGCHHRADDQVGARLRGEPAAAGPGSTRQGLPGPGRAGCRAQRPARRGPHNPDQVLGVYASVIAPAVISADSPRFLGFIPAAPTKASLLFDMLVSCASIQGISWLEAAGAIHAENQVLRLIADRAGMPASGGRLLRLRRLGREPVRAGRGPRDRQAQGRPGAAGRRWRVAVSEDAHSSIINTLRILEMDALVVPTADHRLTGAGLRAAIAADGDPASLAAIVATSGTTNAGHHRRPGRRGRGRARVRPVVPRGRRLRRRGPVRAERPGPVRRDRARRLVHRRPAQVAVRPVRLRGPAVPRPVAGPVRAQAGRLLPRRHPRHAGGVEPDRLRLPPDQARPGPAAVVLAGGVRGRRLQRGHRGGDRAGPPDRGRDQGPRLP